MHDQHEYGETALFQCGHRVRVGLIAKSGKRYACVCTTKQKYVHKMYIYVRNMLREVRSENLVIIRVQGLKCMDYGQEIIQLEESRLDSCYFVLLLLSSFFVLFSFVCVVHHDTTHRRRSAGEARQRYVCCI